MPQSHPSPVTPKETPRGVERVPPSPGATAPPPAPGALETSWIDEWGVGPEASFPDAWSARLKASVAGAPGAWSRGPDAPFPDAWSVGSVASLPGVPAAWGAGREETVSVALDALDAWGVGPALLAAQALSPAARGLRAATLEAAERSEPPPGTRRRGE